MEIKTYDHTDLQIVPKEYGDEQYTCHFVADVAGDNPDIFDGDNREVANKLKSLGAIGRGDDVREEPSCFFVYFKSKEAGIAFLKKLSAYIRQKKRLLEKAQAF